MTHGNTRGHTTKVPRVYEKFPYTRETLPVWHPLDSHGSNTGEARMSRLSPPSTPNPCRVHVTLPGHSEGTREIWPHGTHTAGWPGYELGVHRFDPWVSRVGYVWVQCARCARVVSTHFIRICIFSDSRCSFSSNVPLWRANAGYWLAESYERITGGLL